MNLMSQQGIQLGVARVGDHKRALSNIKIEVMNKIRSHGINPYSQNESKQIFLDFGQSSPEACSSPNGPSLLPPSPL